jgi:diguanylate cyclase (GGDEF)-like protein
VTRQTKRLTQRLHQQAMNDDLTGLLNRRGWRDAAQRELANATRTGSPVALVAIDLDDLKGLNDSMGHDEGDRLLQETADRLRNALRAGDVVARLGGDEFAALLVDATLDRALEVVERLRKVTPELGAFSAGVAARGRDEDLDEMVRRADAALYASKSPRGRGVEVASQGLDSTPDPRDVTSDPGAERGSIG